MSRLSQKKRIAIIGAGIAGLTCANQLAKLGFDVHVFEKSRGVGGRMSHRYYEEWEADHGAQYFTAKDPLFTSQINEWINAGVVEKWNGKIVDLNFGSIRAHRPTTQRYVGVPAMTSPAKFIAKSLNVYTQHSVISIKQINNLWLINTKEHGTFELGFEYLVCAIPSLQAQTLVGLYSEKLKTVCKNVVMLPCWTLIGYFKVPLQIGFEGAFVQGGPLSWIARDNSKPGRSSYETWVVHANNVWSQEHIDLTNFQIEPILLNAFKDATGVDCDLYQSHLWRYAKLESPSELNYVFDEDIRIGLCGDWLKHSTVEGAWLSGFQMAQRLTVIN